MLETIKGKAYQFGNPSKLYICKVDLMILNNVEDETKLNKNSFWISSKGLNFQVIYTNANESYFE